MIHSKSVPDEQNLKSRRSHPRIVRIGDIAVSPDHKRFRPNAERYSIHTPPPVNARNTETPITIDRFGSPTSKTAYGTPESKAHDPDEPQSDRDEDVKEADEEGFLAREPQQEFESVESDEKIILNDYQHCSSYLMEISAV